MINVRIFCICFVSLLFLGCGFRNQANYSLEAQGINYSPEAQGIYDDGFRNTYKSDRPLTTAPVVEYQIKEEIVDGSVKKVNIVFGINGNASSFFDGKTETATVEMKDEHRFVFFVPYKLPLKTPVHFYYRDNPLGAWGKTPQGDEAKTEASHHVGEEANTPHPPYLLNGALPGGEGNAK